MPDFIIPAKLQGSVSAQELQGSIAFSTLMGLDKLQVPLDLQDFEMMASPLELLGHALYGPVFYARYGKGQLAHEFNISITTMNAWLKLPEDQQRQKIRDKGRQLLEEHRPRWGLASRALNGS